MPRVQFIIPRLWRFSIRLQVTLCYTVVFAFLFLLSGVLLYVHLQTTLVESLDVELHLRAQQISGDINTDNGQLKLDGTTSDLPGFDLQYTNPHVTPADVNFGTLARILDSQGKTFRVSPAFRELIVPQTSIRDPLHGIPWQGTVLTRSGQQIRLYSRTITDENKTLGVIQVGAPLSQLNTTLNSILVDLLFIAPFVLFSSAVGSYWLASHAFKPIDHLTRTAQRIQAGDLQQRVPVPATYDEVHRLALTLNEMIESLDKAFSRQRRFVADASHELRTPVAAIRSMTDIALLEPLSQEKYILVLQSINTETERLGRLINDLLALARADEGKQQLERDEVQLDTLVEAVAANAELLASERGITLQVGSSEPLTVLGDEARLIQVVMNLVDNAITYTPGGGYVNLTLEQEQDHACLIVQDTGIGIAPEHLPYIFERFYRADPAHTSTEGGNSGLGLAIVKWVVEAHGGSITVDSQLKRGSTFTVRLPLPD